jgi:primosomal protein N' (replication factor Y) (superfamily II helicase)
VTVARVEPLTTTRRLSGPFDYRLPESPVEVGSVVRIPFGRQTLDGVVTAIAAESEVADDRLVAPTAVRPDSVPPELVECALWMAAEYCSTPARALALVLPPPGRPRTELWWTPEGEPRDVTPRQAEVLARLPGPSGGDLAVLRRLEARGLVRVRERVRRRVPLSAPPEDRRVALTDEQEEVLARMAAGGSFLLHGVTGSGKTEVYLQAAERVLAEGRGVIVLVPEIALTPQTVGRFQARFGDTVALLHSGLSEGERYDEWLRLRRGDARVAVGPRSAVFAPVADLGLVVVDEEHDASYKHEGDPRYDARLVARWRCAYSGAALVCGTATPRPETWRELAHLTLARRVDGRPLPPVEVKDLRGSHHPLHPDTQAALAEVAAAGRKAIVLLNRRGWSNFVTCRDCGQVWDCPNCDVALVLHRASGTIACHHCGHRERVPQRCGRCGSTAVARHGAGTERLEAELADTLGIPVFRLDADTGAAKDAVPRLLAAFRAAPAGLLVGTQLVAKGHDFPDVALGVVVDADQTLRFPDFRAEERTFAMVAQLAGRAGRGGSGRVIVQTLSPEASAIRHAARHDAPGFLREELARREALGYPPFSTLIRIVCSSPEADPPAAAAASLANRLGLPAEDLLGPAPLFRLRGRWRWQLVVRTGQRAAAIAAAGAAVEAAALDKRFRAVAFSVDVDPQ